MRDIGHFIGGKEVKGASGRQGDVFNPNTGEVQAKVALASKSEVEKAIANAEAMALATTKNRVLMTDLQQMSRAGRSSAACLRR